MRPRMGQRWMYWPILRMTAASALRARYASFNQVAFDTHDVNEKGIIGGATTAADLAFARSKNMRTFATVSNFAGGDFTSSIAHAIITSPAITQTFIEGMLKVLAMGGPYTGINVDFESVPAWRMIARRLRVSSRL